ncbi:TPA: hypothetical protein NJ504_004747 [Vibrio parahaemolyticus]|nr:hypothetical protein [Vibrio parahaemolyticus]HCM0852259.1 hypothetical protein [Vibrio parahaemolyticus]
MEYCVKIERIPYEEPYHLQLLWDISNGMQSTRFELYNNASDLLKIAKGLEFFPRHPKDVFLYEIGSERAEDNFAYYFRLRAFMVTPQGQCALQIRFCSNAPLPYKHISEFCIQLEPRDLNRLGILFGDFSKLQSHFLAWDAKGDFLGDKWEYA